jgi:ABC-type multidrug transport system fused ATPase/permease subunit
VDTRTEILIQQTLSRLLKDRTSFVVAQRLSAIRNANQVLVLEEGKVVERATTTYGGNLTKRTRARAAPCCVNSP